MFGRGLFFVVVGLWVRAGVEWMVGVRGSSIAVALECADKQIDEFDSLFSVGAFA